MARTSTYRQSTDDFTFLNLNPKGKFTGDCVIRAIAYALNKDWDVLIDELTGYTHRYKIPYDYAQLYEKYLKDQGYVRVSQPKKVDGKHYSVLEFCRKTDRFDLTHPVLMHVNPHHLTVIHRIDGKMKNIDIWNCCSQKVGRVYIHKDDAERYL